MDSSLILPLVLGFFAFIVFTYFVPIGLWVKALNAGITIKVEEMIAMRIRKSPVSKIVNSLIKLKNAGVEITLMELETHSLASGDVEKLSEALIKAKYMKLPINLKELMAQNLMRNDLMAYLDKKKHSMDSAIDEVKQRLCQRIWEELTDDQVRELERQFSLY